MTVFFNDAADDTHGAEPSGSAPPQWDLSALFSGPNAPALEQSLREIKKQADAFAGRYENRLAGPLL